MTPSVSWMGITATVGHLESTIHETFAVDACLLMLVHAAYEGGSRGVLRGYKLRFTLV